MTANAQLIDQAMSRLGQRQSTRIRADVVTEINSAIDNLERGTFFPWFLETTATLNVSINDTFVTLPADFAIEADESRPYYTLEGTVYYLTKRFYGALVGETPNNLQYYAIRGNEFHFRKAADQAYTITVPYYMRVGGNLIDDALTITNPWLINAKEWILGMALRVVASTHVQNKELASIMAAMETKGKSDLYIHHEARVNTNQDFFVGGSSDGS